MRALEFAGEEFQADVGCLEVFGEVARSMPRPRRLRSWTTRVTATPEARSSHASVTAWSSLGRFAARVEIFSEKIRVTSASVRESSYVSRDWRAVEARA